MKLSERLEAVLALVEMAAPGELTVYDENEGDGWPPRPLWCFKNEAYDEDGDAPALQGIIHYGGKEDADAIASALNFLRDHGPALAELARRVEGAPSVEITACNQIEGARDFDYGDMVAAAQKFDAGQRVRLVPEPPEVG